MDLHKLQNDIEGWLKPLPHLPVEWRKWIANNVWWIVLVGVILSVIVALLAVGALLTAMAVVGTATSILGVTVVQTYTSWWYVAAVASLVFLVITLVINAMAVTPLKAHSKKGWNLLFLSFLVNFLSAVVGVVLNITTASVVGSVISGVLGVVISAYFLFEIRSYFK